jgi:hypothetical protein
MLYFFRRQKLIKKIDYSWIEAYPVAVDEVGAK